MIRQFLTGKKYYEIFRFPIPKAMSLLALTNLSETETLVSAVILNSDETKRLVKGFLQPNELPGYLFKDISLQPNETLVWEVYSAPLYLDKDEGLIILVKDENIKLSALCNVMNAQY